VVSDFIPPETGDFSRSNPASSKEFPEDRHESHGQSPNVFFFFLLFPIFYTQTEICTIGANLAVKSFDHCSTPSGYASPPPLGVIRISRVERSESKEKKLT
jgi:hypothetical protein